MAANIVDEEEEGTGERGVAYGIVEGGSSQETAVVVEIFKRSEGEVGGRWEGRCALSMKGDND